MNEKKAVGMDIETGLFASRLPAIIWISFVYVSAMVLQFIKEPLILQAFVYTGLFTVHGLLHWYSYRFTMNRFELYFSLQAILIYLCAILMPGGYQAILIGLLPVLIAQSLAESFRIKRIVFVGLSSGIILLDSVVTVGNMGEVILLAFIFILMMIIVTAYAILFFVQVHERLRIQNYLEDLQAAHKKVEELTLSNERQRMARDLHDTLAQGVAGLIMRLEAADEHLTQGNVDRAHDIVKQSMNQARRTLAEARRAIDNLRKKSAPEMDFKEAVLDELQHFIDATGISVDTEIHINKPLSRLIMEHSLHIIKECLTNITRHAQADKVWLDLSEQNGRLMVKIIDNGVGFDTNTIGDSVGHYGLLGIRERVRLIGGKIDICSNSKGTAINFEIPLKQGEDE